MKLGCKGVYGPLLRESQLCSKKKKKNERRNVTKETEDSVDSLFSTVSEIDVCSMQRKSSRERGTE